ncbi:hypothetical protein BDN72DRAFT_863060 [Pluteus cervinus]|uniref:Uncharacterized protein n=1 Tax=Pluteus cervinus TaxID=181527 RepID=A0ACD3A8U8_9AGAR|nr:hypothetical protein BDN72DRAFT_863060 [Pluteus cervinus]
MGGSTFAWVLNSLFLAHLFLPLPHSPLPTSRSFPSTRLQVAILGRLNTQHVHAATTFITLSPLLVDTVCRCPLPSATTISSSSQLAVPTCYVVSDLPCPLPLDDVLTLCRFTAMNRGVNDGFTLVCHSNHSTFDCQDIAQLDLAMLTSHSALTC